MATIVEGAGEAALPQLRSTVLAGAALGLLRRHWRALAPIWLAGSAVMAGLYLGAHALGIRWARPDLSAGYWSFEALISVTSAIVGGLALRVFLSEPPSQAGPNGASPGGRFRLDRDFAAYVGLVTLAYLAWTALGLLPSKPAEPDRIAPYAALFFAWLGLVIALIFVTVRLVLWPVAVLAGRREIGPQRSWRLMRGATGGMVGANAIGMLAVIFPLAVAEIALRVKPAAPPAAVTAADAVFGLALGVYTFAIAAAAYQRRVVR